MLKNGFTTAAVEPDLPPLSHHNAQAIMIWNRLGGEIRWPDLLFILALHDVDSVRLMVERLYALREAYR